MPPAPKSVPSASIPFWIWLPAFALLLVIGGAIALVIWDAREDHPRPVAKQQHGPQFAGEVELNFDREQFNQEVLVPNQHRTGLHSVVYEQENGINLVKIRVVPGGDEVVLNAKTGRLIESRPYLPQAKSTTPKLPMPEINRANAANG